MTSRLLRKVLLYDGTGTEAANNVIRGDHNAAGAVDISLTASANGTEYWVSGDDRTDDFIDELVTQLNAETSFPDFTIDILGVGVSESGKAFGRLKIDHDDSGVQFEFLLAHANTTLPTGILGWGEDTVVVSGGTPIYSPSVHRFGWYPQLAANSYDETEHQWGDFIGIRGNANVDGLTWGRFTRREILYLEALLAPWVRQEASESVRWQNNVGLAQGAQWSSWEAFCEDVQLAAAAGNGEDVWRFYPTLTGEYVGGDYRWPADYPGWTDATSAGSKASVAGESWGSFSIEGRRIGGSLPPNTFESVYTSRSATHIWAFAPNDPLADTGSNPIPDLTLVGSTIAPGVSGVPGALGLLDTHSADNDRADFNLTGVTDMGFNANRSYIFVFTSFFTDPIPADDWFAFNDDNAFGAGRGNMISIHADNILGWPVRLNRTGMPGGGRELTGWDQTAYGQHVYVACSYNASGLIMTTYWRVGSGALQSATDVMSLGSTSSGEAFFIGGAAGASDTGDVHVHFFAVLGRTLTASEVADDVARMFA